MLKKFLNFSDKQEKRFYFIIYLVLFIILIIIIKTPILETFEYDLDEGFELMKSSLYTKGFSLYRQIWSDQPPLFSLILSYWLKLSKPSVYYGRILVLIFSLILLWSFYSIIKNLKGKFCAFIAVIFLSLSTYYLRQSIAVMPGIPTLSLALLSLLGIILYRKRGKKSFLVLSGISMACSIETKFSTAFLIPLIILELAQINSEGGKKGKLLPVFLWFIAGSVTYLFITIIFFRFNFRMFIEQLFLPHLQQLDIPGSDFLTIWAMLLSDFDFVLLALIGIIFIIKQKKWPLVFPIFWLILSLLILLIYRPIWYHYYPLFLSVPIAWLAAISFSEFFQINPKQRWFTRKDNYGIFLRFIVTCLVILTILRLPAKYERTLREVWGETNSEEKRIVELLLKFREDTRWILTDRAIFAFYADILVPPELVVTNAKRPFATPQDQIYLIEKLEKYKPGLLLFEQLKFYGPGVISYMEKNYTNVYQFKIPKRIKVADKKFEYVLENWFAKIKGIFENWWPPNRLQPYRLDYRLLDKKTRYQVGLTLVRTFTELVELCLRLPEKDSLTLLKAISPLAILKDGRFSLKPYNKVPLKWVKKFQLKNLPDKTTSFFAYQLLKNILKEWKSGQDKSAPKENSLSMSLKIARLKSLQNAIIEDIKKGEIINSLNEGEFFSGQAYPNYYTHYININLYLQKEIIEKRGLSEKQSLYLN